MGRPVAEVTLTDDERETLVRRSRRATSAQALAQRCRIVLGCAEGKSNQQVAAELGVWPQTVGKWRRRFLESRLDGLADEPRRRPAQDLRRGGRGTRRGYPGAHRHTLVAILHGGRERLVEVHRGAEIWRTFGMRPHQVDSFKLSNDPQFVDKVRDIVGLYLDPPEKALV
ncbi:helix-turn-helix domain-containing protein, partial [Streptomyces sp. NPDC004752]